MSEKQKVSNAAVHTFGCRAFDSKGGWDRAFVFADIGDKKIGAFFDKHDYIDSSSACHIHALKTYSKLITEGYIPMTPQDITSTSGIQIDSNTDLTVH